MQNKIWPYGRGYYKAFFKEYKIKKQIDRWKNVKLGCRYYLVDGQNAWDYIFPAKLYNKFADLLSLPRKTKLPNRVKAGIKVQRLGKRYNFTKVKSPNITHNASKVGTINLISG